MTDEQGTDEQRTDQQTGTGSPRSAPAGGSEPTTPRSDVDAAVVSGAKSTAHPATADEIDVNRSGSGGSGGPVVQDDTVEGSTGETMAELLGGEEPGDTDS